MWSTGFGLLGLALGAAAAWLNVGNFPLEGRVVLCIVGIVVFVLAVAAEFPRWTRKLVWGRSRLYAEIATSLAVAVIATALSFLTVMFHSLRFEHDCRASAPGWMCVKVLPPQGQVDVTLQLATSNRSGPDVRWIPGFWSELYGAGTPTIVKNTPYELTVQLERFAWPAVYGVAFRGTQPGPQVATTAPDISPGNVYVFQSNYPEWFLLEGVVLWLVCWSLLHRSPPWLQRLAPSPKLSGSGTPA